jgi:hypothetical protein
MEVEDLEEVAMEVVGLVAEGLVMAVEDEVDTAEAMAKVVVG